jgi:hypothetical protein
MVRNVCDSFPCDYRGLIQATVSWKSFLIEKKHHPGLDESLIKCSEDHLKARFAQKRIIIVKGFSCVGTQYLYRCF